MKLHKYISAALLTGVLSFGANAALAGDDDMLTDFQANDRAAFMQHDEWQAQADQEAMIGDGPFDVALAYCSTTHVFDDATGELIAVYSVCDDIPDVELG